MTFKEYCSSYITPQNTLVQKFNALLKYIENFKTLKMYKVSFTKSSGTIRSGYFNVLSSESINKNNFFDKLKNIVFGAAINTSNLKCIFTGTQILSETLYFDFTMGANNYVINIDSSEITAISDLGEI